MTQKISRYTLHVAAGTYQADTFVGLITQVVSHRLNHLIKDGKWMD